jgi:hypothetical protein
MLHSAHAIARRTTTPTTISTAIATLPTQVPSVVGILEQSPRHEHQGDDAEHQDQVHHPSMPQRIGTSDRPRSPDAMISACTPACTNERMTMRAGGH